MVSLEMAHFRQGPIAVQPITFCKIEILKAQFKFHNISVKKYISKVPNYPITFSLASRSLHSLFPSSESFIPSGPACSPTPPHLALFPTPLLTSHFFWPLALCYFCTFCCLFPLPILFFLFSLIRIVANVMFFTGSFCHPRASVISVLNTCCSLIYW